MPVSAQPKRRMTEPAASNAVLVEDDEMNAGNPSHRGGKICRQAEASGAGASTNPSHAVGRATAEPSSPSTMVTPIPFSIPDESPQREPLEMLQKKVMLGLAQLLQHPVKHELPPGSDPSDQEAWTSQEGRDKA